MKPTVLLICSLLLVQATMAGAQSIAKNNPATQAVNWTPVIMEAVQAPTKFQGSDRKFNLVYDLILHNFSSQVSELLELSVLDAEHSENAIKTYKGNELKSVFTSFAPGKESKLGAGQSGVVWINLSFKQSDKVPKKLRHRIRVKSKSPLNDPTVYNYKSEAMPVSETSALVISPPLKGKNWVVEGGYSSNLGHRRALFPIDNGLYEAQMYAIDWEKLDDKYVSCHGDPNKSESYVTYGEPVLAVADATVAGTVDKFKNQVPGSAKGKERISNPGGNSITLDLGNGYYAFYAHLKPGSLKVKEGDKVKKGQVIAEAGNTGNSSGPHLHMHISKGPACLASRSVPYHIEQFTVEGELDIKTFDKNYGLSTPHKVSKSAFAGMHKNELPKEGVVISFP